jgi:L-seryl-tRNA(Ser) seleniumtransferase
MVPSSRPPSVDALAREIADVGLPPPLLVDAARAAIAAGDPSSARPRAVATATALLRRVVNGTGVLLHTNLGRAPSAGSAPAGYSNVELDLATGRRGSRSSHAASLLAQATGAEAALTVNNGAAAVLLVLAALARAREVVVSRGELVEIGGGFRVPEVMEQSGARLVEVGTTNRTHLRDYGSALGPATGLVLKVHQSNYRIVGFTASVPVAELAGLCRSRASEATTGPPVVVDLGSGLLDAATPWLAGAPPAWLAGEPAARQTLADGADLVTFSGDKLLGGPQAGVVAGRADLVAACARHPLARALRPGGMVLAALQDTALAYLRRDGDAVPFWRMAATPVEELRARATNLGVGEVIDTVAVAGGGAAPGLEIPSAGIALDGDRSASLRAHDPPVIARVHDGRTVVDLRAVDPTDDQAVKDACLP